MADVQQPQSEWREGATNATGYETATNATVEHCSLVENLEITTKGGSKGMCNSPNATNTTM